MLSIISLDAIWVLDAVALPHKVIEEDEYHGYRIPKNATVMGNVWYVQLLKILPF